MRRGYRMMALAGLVVAAASTSGCATMYHRNNGLRVNMEENGRTVRKLAMNLDHATPELQIYEDGQLLEISQVKDHIFSNATNNSLNQAVARGSCSGRVGTCRYNWNETTEYGPGLFLDPHRPHTLRLVRNGQEATVTVKTKFKVKWYFYDMLLFPLAPVGWVVDGVTGSWNQYPRLDVDRAFRESSRIARSGGEE